MSIMYFQIGKKKLCDFYVLSAFVHSQELDQQLK